MTEHSDARRSAGGLAGPSVSRSMMMAKISAPSAVSRKSRSSSVIAASVHQIFADRESPRPRLRASAAAGVAPGRSPDQLGRATAPPRRTTQAPGPAGSQRNPDRALLLLHERPSSIARARCAPPAQRHGLGRGRRVRRRADRSRRCTRRRIRTARRHIGVRLGPARLSLEHEKLDPGVRAAALDREALRPRI
jgi:hypothetical protein